MSKSKLNTPASLTGDHFTLAQVAKEVILFQTEKEDVANSQATLSDHFLSAAKIYITGPNETGDEMPKDHPFLAACEAQEKISKSPEAGQYQWDKIPSAWSQLKSNIKAAYNIGLDINDYTSESAMRKDLNKLRKEAKEAAKTPEEQATEQVQSAMAELAETGNTELQQRLFAIVEACRKLEEGQVADVVAVLDTALTDIKTMTALTTEKPKRKSNSKAKAA